MSDFEQTVTPPISTPLSPTMIDCFVQTTPSPPSTESDVSKERENLPWTEDKEAALNEANAEEDTKRDAEIEARWHCNHYLDEAGNLWERSDPNRLERSNGWSDTNNELEERFRMLEQDNRDEQRVRENEEREHYEP